MPRSVFLCLFFGLLCHNQVAFSQKNSNSKQDERNENARVAKAEREVAESRKSLSAIQQQLKRELKDIEQALQLLPILKKTVRDAREEAEDRLGAKLGIPEALSQVRLAGKELEQIAGKIRELVHQTNDWQQAKVAAQEANEKRSNLLEGFQEVDEQAIASLTQVIRRPIELEDAAIASDPQAIKASEHLKAKQTELDKRRKLLPEGEVDKDPKVVKAVSELRKQEKSLSDLQEKLRKSKLEANKIQKRLTEDTADLQRARAADAAVRNRPNKGSKK